MLEDSNRILEKIGPEDLVLDVGGWACPFNRANWIIDSGPYETRGFYASIGLPRSQGGDREYFSRETWVSRDLCHREPWPFQDKQFDFSICSKRQPFHLPSGGVIAATVEVKCQTT